MGASDNRGSQDIRRLTYTAMYLALALVLPFITGQIPEIGQALSPMHIPVLLCGFLVGWPWGMAVGFIAPLLRSFLFGMPAFMPGAVSMAFEMAVYGGVSGALRRVLPRGIGYTWLCLIAAMIAGRLVWGAARFVIAGLTNASFPFEAFLAGAVLNAIPGIILHIAVIPPLVSAMERAGLSLNN